MDEIIPQNRCSQCKKTKPLGEFSFKRANSEKRSSWCKSCTNAIHREKRKHRNDVPVPKVRVNPIIGGQKQCTGCNVVKPLTDFGKDASTHDKYMYACKDCINAKSLLHRQKVKSRESILPPEEKRCSKCHEIKPASEFYRNHILFSGLDSRCKMCSPGIYRPADPQKRRERHLKSAYGYSLEQYQKMLLAQQGCCAICNQPPKPGERPLAIDHDHATGKARGLLCFRCNANLGLVEKGKWKQKHFIGPALEYLQNHRQKEDEQAS